MIRFSTGGTKIVGTRRFLTSRKRSVAGTSPSYPTPLRAISHTGAANPSIPLPATAVAGDLIIVQIEIFSTTVPTLPAGAVSLQAVSGGVNPGTNTYYWVFSYVAAGGETSLTFSTTTAGASSWTIHQITHGTYTGPPVASAIANGTGTAPQSPALTPVWGSAQTLWLSLAILGVPAASFSGYPAGFSNGQTDNAGSFATASAELNATVATETPGAFTTTLSEIWLATTVAIQPLPTMAAQRSQALIS